MKKHREFDSIADAMEFYRAGQKARRAERIARRNAEARRPVTTRPLAGLRALMRQQS